MDAEGSFSPLHRGTNWSRRFDERRRTAALGAGHRGHPKSRRFLAGSNAAADNHRIGNARSSLHGGLSRTRVRLPPPPPLQDPITTPSPRNDRLAGVNDG